MNLLQTFLRFTKSQKSDKKAAPEQPVQGSAYKEKTFHVSVIACTPDGRKFPHVQRNCTLRASAEQKALCGLSQFHTRREEISQVSGDTAGWSCFHLVAKVKRKDVYAAEQNSTLYTFFKFSYM